MYGRGREGLWDPKWDFLVLLDLLAGDWSLGTRLVTVVIFALCLQVCLPTVLVLVVVVVLRKQ